MAALLFPRNGALKKNFKDLVGTLDLDLWNFFFFFFFFFLSSSVINDHLSIDCKLLRHSSFQPYHYWVLDRLQVEGQIIAHPQTLRYPLLTLAATRGSNGPKSEKVISIICFSVHWIYTLDKI